MYFIGVPAFKELCTTAKCTYITPSLINPRTYFFKKVCAAAFNFEYISLILTRVFSKQKSRLLFYDIIMPNTPLSFLLFLL